MRTRIAILGALLASCTFDASAAGDGGSGGGGSSRGEEGSSTGGSTSSGAATGDGGSSTTGGAGLGSTSSGEGSGTTMGPGDTGDVPRSFCPSQPELVGCYDFADVAGGMLWDGSGQDNHGTAAGVGVVAGPFGEAATFDDDSEVAVPDTSSLDIDGPFTVEAWVMIDALPRTDRMGVLDKDGQYSMTIQADGRYRCSADAEVLAGTVTTGTWQHMACVYDGAALRVFVDGTELGMIALPNPPQTANTEPMSIGDTSPDFDEPLRGAIGGLRIWTRALDPAELCEAAGEACTG